MYVSPFYPVSGGYRFHFNTDLNRPRVRIDHYDRGRLQLNTAIWGESCQLAISPVAALIRQPFSHPGRDCPYSLAGAAPVVERRGTAPETIFDKRGNQPMNSMTTTVDTLPLPWHARSLLTLLGRISEGTLELTTLRVTSCASATVPSLGRSAAVRLVRAAPHLPTGDIFAECYRDGLIDSGNLTRCCALYCSTSRRWSEPSTAIACLRSATASAICCVSIHAAAVPATSANTTIWATTSTKHGWTPA